VDADFFVEFAPAGRSPSPPCGSRRRQEEDEEGERLCLFFWKEKLAVGHEVRKRKLSVTSDSGPPVSGVAAGCRGALTFSKIRQIETLSIR
jgi:hypothetical protein